MSKKSRSLITILSLALMLVAGMLTPYSVQARKQGPEKSQTVVWQASEESAAQFQELAKEMGAEIRVANARQAKRLQASSDVQLSEDQVSANELANWAKVQKQITSNGDSDGGDGGDVQALLIIIKGKDWVVVIYIP